MSMQERGSGRATESSRLRRVSPDDYQTLTISRVRQGEQCGGCAGAGYRALTLVMGPTAEPVLRIIFCRRAECIPDAITAQLRMHNL